MWNSVGGLLLTILILVTFEIGRVAGLRESEKEHQNDKTHYAIRLQNCIDVITHNSKHE